MSLINETVTDVDTSDHAIVHRSIRSAGHALAVAAESLRPDDHDRMDAFVSYWNGHAGEILVHHRIEDTIFFPALRSRAADRARVLDLLDAEHHGLDVLMERCRAAIEGVVTGDDPGQAAQLLDRLADLMDDHLDLEDREILPHFGRWFSSVEYTAMTKAAIRQVGLGRQAAFTIPYLAFWADEAQRRTLLEAAPLPFRILYRMARKRHGALAAAALGGAVVDRVARC